MRNNYSSFDSNIKCIKFFGLIFFLLLIISCCASLLTTEKSLADTRILKTRDLFRLGCSTQCLKSFSKIQISDSNHWHSTKKRNEFKAVLRKHLF